MGSLCLSLPLLPYGDGLGGLHLPHPVVRFGRPGRLLVPGKHQGLVGGDVCIILTGGLVALSVSLGAPQCCCSLRVRVPRCPAGLLLRPCPSVPRRGGSIVSILILCGDKRWSGHGWSLFVLTMLRVGVVSMPFVAGQTAHSRAAPRAPLSPCSGGCPSAGTTALDPELRHSSPPASLYTPAEPRPFCHSQ